jgi:endonuclease-8
VLEAPEIRRTASAMRTALIGRPTIRFESSHLAGPAPRPGRVVERIDCRARSLDLVWDDGLVLHTGLRRSGSWHLYRIGDRWRRPQREVDVMVEADDWVAVCFNASEVETYRSEPIDRHPSRGRVGPDLADPDTDLSAVVDSLIEHRDQSARIRDVLLDPRVVRGLGNVFAAEVLWANRMSPWARVGDIARSDLIMLVNTASRLLRAHLAAATPGPYGRDPLPLEVYGRNGQMCSRCAEALSVTRTDGDARLLYWCAGCQTRMDRRLLDDTPVTLDRAPDPR